MKSMELSRRNFSNHMPLEVLYPKKSTTQTNSLGAKSVLFIFYILLNNIKTKSTSLQYVTSSQIFIQRISFKRNVKIRQLEWLSTTRGKYSKKYPVFV